METTEAGYRPGDRVEWNPTGDEWKPGTVHQVGGVGVLIRLDENGQTLLAQLGHLRQLDAGDPVEWLTTAGSAEPQCETVASIRADRDRLAADLAELHTWRGLMALLDEHLPADVFDGRSNDPGARIAVLMRALDAERALRATESAATADVSTCTCAPPPTYDGPEVDCPAHGIDPETVRWLYTNSLCVVRTPSEAVAARAAEYRPGAGTPVGPFAPRATESADDHPAAGDE